MTGKKRNVYTYTSIHSIMPAPGWHAVYFIDTQHEAVPIYVLALVSDTTYEMGTDQEVKMAPEHCPEASLRYIVGMDYTPADGFNNVQDAVNYCGLMPPDMTLDDFEQRACCIHAPQKDILTV